MTIRELRILPPFAIGRLGSASTPLANYTIDNNPDQPLGFRRIQGARTLDVVEETGEIGTSWIPETVTFKQGSHIRPVAPFLEVFAVSDDDTLKPLDVHLLESLGAKLEWRVSVANRKVVRRTGDEKDLVAADTGPFFDHHPHRLLGHSDHFAAADKSIDFGSVRFIRPNEKFPEIRLRFTPAKGLIYGPTGPPAKGVPDTVIPPDRAVYDRSKDWFDFGKEEVKNETLPPSLYAINPPAPSWLNNNIAISRGYLDDSCDGFAEVTMALPDGTKFTATARICAGPPALAPDSLFVRSLADDLDQVLHGPKVATDEPYEVTRDRAANIVRRAYETVRFMNVAMMNGNNFKGRSALDLDTMAEEEAADTERALRPIMGSGSVDTLAILALHEQVYAALRGGAAPWFVDLLRQPNEVGDFTDRGRRKMPALMCGADNSYLALTYRQIDTIRQAAEKSLFHTKTPEPEHVDSVDFEGQANPSQLRPRNLSAQLHYEAAGNPISSRPITSVANCCPGLEVDFRAVWRRMFRGVVLREYDNLVVVDDEPGLRDLGKHGLTNHRLLRVRVPKTEEELQQEKQTRLEDQQVLLKKKETLTLTEEGLLKTQRTGQDDDYLVSVQNGLANVEEELASLQAEMDHPKTEWAILTTTEIKGPATSDPSGWILLTTEDNPYGLTSLEWSNALAYVLSGFQGQEVWCDFTSEASDLLVPLFEGSAKDGDPKKNYISRKFEVRHFFQDDTAVISKALAEAGELTQGLCSPWQNDYRECSCYYWASARPDYINVEPGPDGLSRGDNWLQKERTGSYVPDDYSDSRLILYDDLFDDWQKCLKFQIGGRDVPDMPAEASEEGGI